MRAAFQSRRNAKNKDALRVLGLAPQCQEAIAAAKDAPDAGTDWLWREHSF